MFGLESEIQFSMFELQCLSRRSLAKAGSMSRLRSRGRFEESGANDVRADRAFVARGRFGSQASSANALESQLFEEFCSTRFQARHATSSGRESPRQKAFVVLTA